MRGVHPTEIVGIEGGNELPPESPAVGKDLRLARAPGQHEFIVRHKNYSERFRVSVQEGRVTFLSFRRQVIGVRETGLLTNRELTYLVRGSIGQHALPADPATTDPTPYLAALGDTDWGTRHYALERLAALKPALDGEAAARLRRMALEDQSQAVREAARDLLLAKALPVPAPPLIFDSFEDNNYNRWYVGGGKGDPVNYSIEADGYQIASTDAREHPYLVPSRKLTLDETDFSGFEKRSDLDFVLDCTWKIGAVTNGYGLVLGRDQNAFQVFVVARNGGAMSASFAGGAWKPASLPWIQTAAPPRVVPPTTRILVSKRGSSYSMSVNGLAVGTVVDQENMPLKSIGFFVSGAQAVVFNRLIVSAP